MNQNVTLPRFQLTVDNCGAPRVHTTEVPLRPLRPLREAKRKKFLGINRHSVTVPIWKTHWTDPRRRRTYTSFVVGWRDDQGRHREKRATLAAALARAEVIHTALVNGGQSLLRFGPADQASYARALQLLRSIASTTSTPSLEIVVGIYTELVQKLGAAGTLAQAVDFFLAHRPRGAVAQNIPALVVSLLEDKTTKGKGKKWLRTLKQQLERFAKDFTGPLSSVQAHEISHWLDGLRNKKDAKPVCLWTRKNYRAAIGELVRFAQAQGQLARAYQELKHVDNPEPPPVEVEIYTPEQFMSLLSERQRAEGLAPGHRAARAKKTLIPFLVLTGFAGIRHEEMTGTKALLDWRDINLDEAVIRIKKTVAKKKVLRLVPMQPNLVAWLRPHWKPSGRVCELSNTSSALNRTKKRAGLPSGRGQLTNALRSSFISYRLAATKHIGQVAREAGNSPKVIEDDYLELVSPAEAERWFNIYPVYPIYPKAVQLGLAGL